MRILIIDNFDSFTYNIANALSILKQEVVVLRSNLLSAKAVKKIKPDRVIISPGPGHPEDAKSSLQFVHEFHKSIPIFGICLGHQIIAHYFECKVISLPEPIHGKKIKIKHDKKTIFNKLESPLEVGVYNSLIVDKVNIANCFIVSAHSTKDNNVMALRHQQYPIESVQFHPDSILTKFGIKIFSNWLNYEY